MVLKFDNQDSSHITTLFIMSILLDILDSQNEVCYNGNQLTAVLMSCKNKEETVLAYDPIHLDYKVELSK